MMMLLRNYTILVAPHWFLIVAFCNGIRQEQILQDLSIGNPSLASWIKRFFYGTIKQKSVWKQCYKDWIINGLSPGLGFDILLLWPGQSPIKGPLVVVGQKLVPLLLFCHGIFMSPRKLYICLNFSRNFPRMSLTYHPWNLATL